MFKRIVNEEKGFALITVILVLVVMSILGLTIVSTTTSNFKMTKIDSKSQSAYYIAEAGINHMIDKINTEVNENGNKYETSEKFFQYIEDKFTKNPETLDSFEKSNGVQPEASITVSNASTDIDTDTRDYRIESVGKIGNSTRIVCSIVSISWESSLGTISIDDLFIYASSISFMGNTINGQGGTLVTNSLTDTKFHGGTNLSVTNMYFDGPVSINKGSVSLGNSLESGNIYVNGGLELLNWGDVYGDVYVKGKLVPGGASFSGNVYVDGDVDLSTYDSMGTIKHVEYTGNLNDPKNLGGLKFKKVTSVPSFEVPKFSKIKFKEDSWYRQNNYNILGKVTSGRVTDNAKIFAEDYTGQAPAGIKGNIIVVSKGDINITAPHQGTGMTGALIAPNGSVKVGQENFTGIIISEKGFTSTVNGGATINMLKMSKFFPNDDIPIEVEGLGVVGDHKSKLEIKEPIKEK